MKTSADHLVSAVRGLLIIGAATISLVVFAAIVFVVWLFATVILG